MNVNVDDREFDGTHKIEDGSRIVLRTQSQNDKAGLLKLCPHDQSVPCRARWSEDGVNFIIEKAPDVTIEISAGGTNVNPDDRAALMAMNDADLQTYAAERNVEWDAKASKQTMVNRILKAAANAPRPLPIRNQSA